MYNWNIDTKQLKKIIPEFDKFVLEQHINYGLNNSKLSLEKLKRHWKHINIDPVKRNYLKKIDGRRLNRDAGGGS